jgi:hypothetical protein
MIRAGMILLAVWLLVSSLVVLVPKISVPGLSLALAIIGLVAAVLILASHVP